MPNIFGQNPTRTCQLTVGLTFTCLQTEVNDHLSCLEVTWSAYWWFFKSELPLQMSSYQNFSRCWIGTDPIQWPKILLPVRSNQRCILQYEFEAAYLKLHDHRAGINNLKYFLILKCTLCLPVPWSHSLKHGVFDSYYGYSADLIPTEGGIFSWCMGSVPTQSREEFWQLLVCSCDPGI